MSQQIIDIGASPNDGLGDPIRSAFGITNNNFTQLFAFPNSAPPTLLVGKPGDVPGMYAYSPSYFYYCFGTYDGTSIIWAELPSASSNIAGSYIANGVSNVSVNYNGNITVAVAGAANVATFTTNGVSLIGNVSANNINAGYLYGNGYYLTGIPGTTGTNYSNANVAAYLPTYSGNIGNIVANSITTPTQIVAAGNITTSGYFIGTFLGNITGNIVVPGSTNQVVFNNNGSADAVAGLTYNPTSNTLAVLGNISAQGNVFASQVNATSISTSGIVQANGVTSTGCGAFSNGIFAGISITSNGLISATGNIYGNYIIGNFVGTSVANTAVTVTSHAQPNITSVGNTLTIGAINLNGNTNTISTNTVNTISVVATSITGNIETQSQTNITSIGLLTGLSVTGSTLGSDLSLSGNIAANGFVSVNGNILANSNVTIANALSVNGGTTLQQNLSVGGNVSTFGNIIGNNATIYNNLSVGVDMSAQGNISAHGNILAQGTVSASGNIITAGYFLGNFQGNVSGNLVVNGSNTQVLFNDNGNAGAAAGLTYISGPNILGILGTVTAQGNIYGGNITSNGLATLGNILTANITSTDVYSNNVHIANNFFANSSILYARKFVGGLQSPGLSGQMLYNGSGEIGAISGLTYDVVSNTLAAVGTITTNSLTANVICGVLTTSCQPNINRVSSVLNIGPASCGTLNARIINGSSIVGSIVNSSQTNISAVGTLYNLSVNGTTTSGLFSGNGAALTSLTGSAVTGLVPLATTAIYAGTVTTNSQPNITTVGTLTSLSVTGAVSAAGGVITPTTIYAGGTISATGSIGTTSQVYTMDGLTFGGPAASGIYGDNTNLAVRGYSGGSIYFQNASGVATYGIMSPSGFNLATGTYTGNGSGLTNIPGANVTGTVGYATNATQLVSGAWTIAASGATISFYYGGTRVFTIDSSGDITSLNNITAYGSP